MKAIWLKYSVKIDALSSRERLVVFVAGLLIAVAVVFLVAIDPAERRQKVLLAQIEAQRIEIAALEAQSGAAQAPADADAPSRTRAEALSRQISALDETLKALQRDLVPAERVNTLLQEILARDPKLALVSLRTVGAEPLAGGGTKSAGASDPAGRPAPQKRESTEKLVYKHGVEITIQGGYASLYDYLLRLERSPLRMYWWRARLMTDDEARLTLTVTLYTLSLDKAWLRV